MARRPIQLSDIENPRLLFDYLREQERELEQLRASMRTEQPEFSATDLNRDHFRAIRNALQAGGVAQLTVDGMLGLLNQPQYPNVPKLSTLPDPQATLYTMVIIDGGASGDTLYVLDKTVNPHAWLDFTALISAHATTHETGGSDALTGSLDANARVGVRVNSTGTPNKRRTINFIPGSSRLSISYVDDSGNEETDLTIDIANGGQIAYSSGSSATSLSNSTDTALETVTIGTSGSTVAGYYVITGSVRFESNAVGIRRGWISINGSARSILFGESDEDAVATNESAVCVAAQSSLSLTDTVRLMAYQDSGGALLVDSRLSVVLVS